MVNFSRIYESGGPFNTGGGGGTADYAFMMLFGCAAMLLSYILLAGIIPPVFTRNLSYFVLYVWSKQNPEAPANIWGFPLKAMWLPFAYLAVTVLMGNSFWDVAHGIAIGHIYYFLVEVVPSVYRKDVLHTPQLLIDYFGVGEYVPPQPVRNLAAGQGSNVWQAPGRAQPPRDPGGAGPTRGHNWGEGGQRLGAS